MHKFDYSFLKDEVVPAGLINLVASISSMKTDMHYQREKNSSVFEGLLKVAKVQSIKSSNEIEGIVTSDSRLDAIVNQSSSPLNKSEAEIAGYRDALALIHENYERMDFSIETILRLHRVLLSYTTDDYGGKYKTEDNVIVEIDGNQNRSVRFKPMSAADTPFQMEQLILSFMDARDQENINPLILIPCVILDFLCIHPFKDGNGRMSRLLTLLLLYKSGLDVGKYISFEEQINNHKNLYYDSLKKASIGWDDNTNDYVLFIMDFLFTLNLCYKELNKRFDVSGRKSFTKKNRIESLVYNSLSPLSKKDILAFLPDISATTVEVVLGEMVKKDKIKKVGNGRSTKYYRK